MSNLSYLDRKNRNAVASDAEQMRRAAAGISATEDKFIYRVGPKARAVMGAYDNSALIACCAATPIQSV